MLHNHLEYRSLMHIAHWPWRLKNIKLMKASLYQLFQCLRKQSISYLPWAVISHLKWHLYCQAVLEAAAYEYTARHRVCIYWAAVSRMLLVCFYNKILQCLGWVLLHYLAHQWRTSNWMITLWELWRCIWHHSSNVYCANHYFQDLNISHWFTENINKGHSNPTKWNNDAVIFNVRAYC